MPQQSEELERTAGRVRSALASTPQLAALFSYLWEQQEAPIRHRAIWETGRLKELSRIKDKDKKSADYDYRPNIRQAVLDLRGALKGYFARHRQETWRIDLPDAVPGVGYQLRSMRVGIDFKETLEFWRPHLQSEHPVAIVYVEHLFYYDPEKGLVFRYYDCNEEHLEKALPELHGQHGDAHPGSQNGSIRPIYPYVAKGEALANHRLIEWFSKRVALKVQQQTTRNLHHDDIAKEESLILVGSASSNRFIRQLLEGHQDTPVTLEERTRIRLLSPTAEEDHRIKELVKGGYCHCVAMDGGCVIEFASERGWPGVLTRLPNAPGSQTPTTIFNSDFGSAVLALTDFLTDDSRLQKGLQALRVSLPFPEYFQFLYCVDAVRHDTKPRIHPIAWREYTPPGF